MNGRVAGYIYTGSEFNVDCKYIKLAETHLLSARTKYMLKLIVITLVSSLHTTVLRAQYAYTYLVCSTNL